MIQLDKLGNTLTGFGSRSTNDRYSLLRRYKQLLQLLFITSSLFLSTSALATRLEFIDNILIGVREGNEWARSVSLLGRIINRDGYASQRVYLKVRANISDTPFSSGHTIAEGFLGQLSNLGDDDIIAGGEVDIINGWFKLQPPPAGTYYLYAYIFEYPNVEQFVSYGKDLGQTTFTGLGSSTGGGGTGTGSAPSGSAGLDLQCACSFSISGSQVDLRAAGVANQLGRTTGTLKLKLWATSTPYGGRGPISGYELAVHQLPVVLGKDTSLQNLNPTVAFSSPPAGKWYLTMTLTETSGGQDMVMDHINFTETLTVPAGGGGSSGSGSGGGGGVGLDILCDCSYETSGKSILVRVNRIENNSGKTSAPLSLKLMATARPYSGTSTNAYQMAEMSIGTLANGGYVYDIANTLSYTEPPPGTWHVNLVLMENGDTPVDYINFDRSITIAPASTGTNPTRKRLDIECNCSYEISGNSVNLIANRVTNNGTGSSGSLQLRLYATQSAYNGGTLTGYKLASYSFSSALQRYGRFENVKGAATYTAPPSGTYYYTLALIEIVNGSESIADYATFSGTVKVGGGGGVGTGVGTTTDPFVLDPWNGYKASQIAALTEHYFRFTLPVAGNFTIETSGALDTVGKLALGSTLITTGDFGGQGGNFRISQYLQPGTYTMQLYDKFGRQGFYSLQTTFDGQYGSVGSSASTSGEIASAGILGSAGVALTDPASLGRSSFGVGASRDQGKTFTNSVFVGERVQINALVVPETADIGKSANLYVVQVINGVIYMVNSTGTLVPFPEGGGIDALLPFRSNHTLTASNNVTFTNGSLSAAGEHVFFVAYKVGNGDLRYGPTPVVINVTP